MKAITLLQPQKIVFGTGCIQTFVEDYKKMGLQRLFEKRLYEAHFKPAGAHNSLTRKNQVRICPCGRGLYMAPKSPQIRLKYL